MANEQRLIDANALIEWLKKVARFLKGTENSKAITHIIGKIIDHVEAMPTVDAAPVVHGRWIPIHKAESLSNWVECSECNTVGSPFWKRCPVCEAKMEGDGNG